jgi:hypothetical protein
VTKAIKKYTRRFLAAGFPERKAPVQADTSDFRGIYGMYKKAGDGFNALSAKGKKPFLYSEATGKTTAELPLVTLEGKAAKAETPAPLRYIDGGFDKAEVRGHTVKLLCRNLNEAEWSSRGEGRVRVEARNKGRSLFFDLPRDIQRAGVCEVSFTLPEDWEECVLCYDLRGIPFGERLSVTLGK